MPEQLLNIKYLKKRIIDKLQQLHFQSASLKENLNQGDVSPRDNTRLQWGRQTDPIHTQLISIKDQKRNLLKEYENLDIKQQEVVNEIDRKQKQKVKRERIANMSDSEKDTWVQNQWDKTSGLSDADSATDWYHTLASDDPQAIAEWDKNAATVSSIGLTIATLPFTAGMTGGWIPALTSTATSIAGGHAGLYSAQQLGQYIDNKYGWSTTPYLSTVGGLAGGILGGGLGYKGWEGATNQYLINKAFKSGQLKYGQPTAYTAYHQSATPVTKFKFPFKERWDVRTHGADPNGAFFTVEEPAIAGFLAERPYTGQFHVKVQKPLIQTGELSGPTKNSLRNAIVRRARKNGADAVFFDGIADNQLQNQQILFAMDNADIGYRGMISTPFKQGNWQLPRGMRNNDKNLVSMQDLVPSKFISIPGLKPIGGKMIADNVVNHPHILDRTRRLQ